MICPGCGEYMTAAYGCDRCGVLDDVEPDPAEPMVEDRDYGEEDGE